MFSSLSPTSSCLCTQNLRSLVESQFEGVREELLLNGSIHLDTTYQDEMRGDIVNFVLQQMGPDLCSLPNADCLCQRIQYRLARQMIARFCPWKQKTVNPVVMAESAFQRVQSAWSSLCQYVGKQAKFRCREGKSSV